MPFTKKKILVADDDPGIVEATTLILTEFGYDVNSTQDGASIYHLEKDFPDILLLDIKMANHDGREICKYLKNNEPTKHIPIIMISASRNIKKSAEDSGADNFLAKPFSIEELVSAIEQLTT